MIVNFQQESGVPDKSDHSQLSMQNKMRLDMNIFKFSGEDIHKAAERIKLLTKTAPL